MNEHTVTLTADEWSIIRSLLYAEGINELGDKDRARHAMGRRYVNIANDILNQCGDAPLIPGPCEHTRTQRKTALGTGRGRNTHWIAVVCSDCGRTIKNEL